MQVTSLLAVAAVAAVVPVVVAAAGGTVAVVDKMSWGCQAKQQKLDSSWRTSQDAQHHWLS